MTRLNRAAELGSWGFLGLDAHGASAAKPGRRGGTRRGGAATGKNSAVRRAALAALEVLEDRTLMSTVATGLPHWLEQGPGPIENGQTAGLLPIGPDGLVNPVAGAASAVALVPGDPNTIYLGTINGGIWKTTNADTQMVGGMPTWQPLTDQNPSLSVGALVLDPSDASHQTLWAGMAHRSSFQNRGGPLTGIVRSADGGATWNAIDPATFADTNVFNIVPLPATASGQTVLVATSDGLFRRTDPSQSFSKVSGPLPNGPVSQLVQAPGNPNRLYVSFPLNGVFTSPDGGANWFNASGDLPTARTKDANRIRLAVHSNAGSPDGDVVYAAFVNKDGDLVGVSRSTDHGAHWSDLGRPETTETKLGGGGTVQFTITPGKQGQTHLSLVADPDDSNTVFIGGDRQPLTHNDGIQDGANSLGATVPGGNLFRFGPDNANNVSWQPVTFSGANGTAPHADSRDMVFNSNGDIVELDDGGVYKLSRPNAPVTRHWVAMDGNLANAELLSIAYDPTNGGVIAGAQDIGTGYEGPSAAFPDKWFQAMGGDGVRVRVSPMDTDNDGHPDQTIRYFAAQDLNVTRVTVGANGQVIVPATPPAFEVNGSGGKAIEDVEKAIPAPAGKSTGSTIAFNTRFQPNAVSPKRLLIGTNYLYESTDAGDHLDALAGLTPVGSSFRPDAAGDLGRVTSIVYGGRLNGADAPDVAWVGAVGKGDGQVLLRTSAGNTFQAAIWSG